MDVLLPLKMIRMVVNKVPLDSQELRYLHCRALSRSMG